MPNSTVALLERLLEDDTVAYKEHVIETASRHVGLDRSEQNFDSLVREVSAVFGEPDFNSSIKKEAVIESQDGSGEQKKSLATVVPPWCLGAARNGGTPKALRLAHWKRPEGVLYIVLRTEIDLVKDIALYYDLVLGARRRKPEMGRTTANLRQTEKTFMSHVVDFFKWFSGR